MGIHKVTKACGHEVEVFFKESEERNPNQAIIYEMHSRDECDECYAKKNNCREVRMHWGDYRNGFGGCRTKGGSYNNLENTVIVYIPNG